MDQIEIHLLGTFAVTVGGTPVPASAWPQRRAADLVKLLALARGHRLPRDRVLEALWPHLEPQPAAAALYKAAHYARRALGRRDGIVLTGGVVALAPGAEIVTDVARFEGGADYGGELLPDDRYEAWTTDERERLQALALRRRRAAGDVEGILALDPADEEAHRRLMRTAAQAGDRSGVARAYGRLRSELAGLGMQPSPESQRLFRDLSRGPAVTAPLGEQVPMAGRATELANAVSRLDAADGGRGGALLLVGEAGSGRTRLAEAVLHEAAQRRWHTVRISARTAPDVVGAARAALRADRPDLGAQGRDVLVAAADERGCAVLLEELESAPDAAADALQALASAAAAHRLLVIATWQPSEARARLHAARGALLDRRLATEIALARDTGVRPTTRYATTEDGARIAFQVIGDGPTDIVLVPGFVSNVEHLWDMPTARRMFTRLSTGRRLIIWDKRGTGLSDPVAERLFDRWGTGALLKVFAPSHAADPASREIFGRFQRTGASPSMGRAMVHAMLDIDVRPLLGDVRAPTLVLHRAGDRMVNPGGARVIAERVPGATYVELPGDDHFPFLGDMDDVVDEIEAFLAAGDG